MFQQYAPAAKILDLVHPQQEGEPTDESPPSNVSPVANEPYTPHNSPCTPVPPRVDTGDQDDHHQNDNARRRGRALLEELSTSNDLAALSSSPHQEEERDKHSDDISPPLLHHQFLHDRKVIVDTTTTTTNATSPPPPHDPAALVARLFNGGNTRTGAASTRPPVVGDEDPSGASRTVISSLTSSGDRRLPILPPYLGEEFQLGADDLTMRSNCYSVAAAGGWSPYMKRVSGPPGSATSTTVQRGAQYTLIANVPYDTVRQDLVVEFRKYGRVELAMVVCDEASRHPHKEWTSTAGYAFVRFSQRSEAAAAIQAASLGLITIRGTRVRADWARKDSYAKRGRVSPTQGAPLLGPMGVPDGIEQLRHSLLEHQRQLQQVAGTPKATGNNLSQFFPFVATNTKSGGVVTNDRSPSTSASEGGAGGGNLEVLQALQEAFTQLLTSRNPPVEGPPVLHTAPTTPEVTFHDESYSANTPTPLDNNSHHHHTHYHHHDPASTSSSASGTMMTTIDLFQPAPTLLQCNPTTTQRFSALHEDQEAPSGLEDVLSPCSRGLLAQALSDVVGAAGITSAPDQLRRSLNDETTCIMPPRRSNFFPNNWPETTLVDSASWGLRRAPSQDNQQQTDSAEQPT